MSTRAVVGIVFHSATGANRKMALAVQRGAEEAGAEVRLHEIRGADIEQGRLRADPILEDLDGCDAIVFGCPTYMGGVSAQMKAFLDATLSRWMSEAWKDKLAGGFTVSSAPSGDKSATLSGLYMTAMQLGMIWVGQGVRFGAGEENRLGFHGGAAGQTVYGPDGSGLDPADAKSGELLGRRMAELGARLKASSTATARTP